MALESTEGASRMTSDTERAPTSGTLATSPTEACGVTGSRMGSALSETSLTTLKRRDSGSVASSSSGCQKTKKMRDRTVRVLSVKTLPTGKDTRVTFYSRT